jgi:phosphoenolpyruvate carboxylase
VAEKGQERIKILTMDAAQALQSFKAILEKDRSDELCEELSKRKPVLSIYLNFKTDTKENEELVRASSELSKMKLSNSRNVYVNN